MVDPVSIAAGVATLIGVAVNVGNELDKFRHDMSSIGSDILMLIEETTGLRKVLQSMATTFEKPEIAQTLEATGHIGGHWQNISQSLEDTEKILTTLLEILQDANKTTSFLDTPRRLLRYRMVEERVKRFTGQVCSCKATLQLSLQTVTLWEQTRTQISMELAISNIDNLDKTIARMARDLARRLEILEQLQIENRNDEAKAEQSFLSNLQECVRSSDILLSSASTILSGRSDDQRLSIRGSLYGDSYPPNADVAAWVASSRNFATGSRSMSYTPSIRAPASPGIPGFTIEAEKDDSDDDLDNELVRVLLKRGHENMASKEYDFAESNFRNCLKQLEIGPRRQRTRKAEIQRLLIDCLMQKGNYAEARAELHKRLALYQSQKGRDDGKDLEDLELLVKALHAEHNFAEAQLYGRRLLDGFRAQGEKGHAGVERSLRQLILTCQEGNDTDEEHAYSAFLAVFLEETAEQPLIDLSSDTLISLASSQGETFKIAEPDPAAVASSPESSGQGIKAPSQDIITVVSRTDDQSPKVPGILQGSHVSRPGMGPFIREGVPQITVDTSGPNTPRSVTPMPSSGQKSPARELSPSVSPRFSWQSDAVSPELDRTASFTTTNASASRVSDIFDVQSPATSATLLSPLSATTGFSHSTPTLYSSKAANHSQETIAPRHRRTRSSSSAGKRRKLLCLGDAMCGKTALLSRCAKGTFQPWMSNTTFDNYVCNLSVASEDVEFAFYDTNGSEDYDSIRPYSYAGTDIVLLCFAINLPYALLNIDEKWVPEMKARLDGVPFVLVGTLADVRTEPRANVGVSQLVTFEQAEDFADRIGALKYFETSAKSGRGIKELFEYVALQCLIHDNARAQRRKSFSGMLRRSMQNLSLKKSP